jgi:hypothetical protein
MAPKKKGGAGKKDAKKDGGDGDGELNPQELLRRAAFRIESLERQLAWREEKMSAALASQRELKERVALYHEDFEREKASIFDIASDMTRQYKGMQARAAAATQHAHAARTPQHGLLSPSVRLPKKCLSALVATLTNASRAWLALAAGGHAGADQYTREKRTRAKGRSRTVADEARGGAAGQGAGVGAERRRDGRDAPEDGGHGARVWCASRTRASGGAIGWCGYSKACPRRLDLMPSAPAGSWPTSQAIC